MTTSNSPLKGSGIPNQFLGVLLHTIAMSGRSRVRTELFQLLVIPALGIIQYRRTASRRASATLAVLLRSNRQVDMLAVPLRQTAHRHLRDCPTETVPLNLE